MTKRLFNMNEWGEICRVHSPKYMESKCYWRSSIAEIYWKLIPADLGLRKFQIEDGHILGSACFIPQDGHKMFQFTYLDIVRHSSGILVGDLG